MGYQGKVIEEPKTPGARRVWELVSILQQASEAWEGLANSVAAGYSTAWHSQSKVLSDVHQKRSIQVERVNLILAIVAAGVTGGMMAGVMGGLFVGQAAAQLGPLLVNNLSSEAVKSAAVKYLNISSSGGFAPVGMEPSTYSARMQENVSILFMMLRRVVAGIIKELEDGRRPFAAGDEYYKGFLKHPVIAAVPDDRDLKRANFAKDASIALWMSWGAEQNIHYWNKRWEYAERRLDWSAPAKTHAAREELDTLGPIMDDIIRVAPNLVSIVSKVLYNPNGGTVRAYLDVRRLKDLGLYHSPALKSLSEYFGLPNRETTFSDALKLIMSLDDKVAQKINAAQVGR